MFKLKNLLFEQNYNIENKFDNSIPALKLLLREYCRLT